LVTLEVYSHRCGHRWRQWLTFKFTVTNSDSDQSSSNFKLKSGESHSNIKFPAGWHSDSESPSQPETQAGPLRLAAWVTVLLNLKLNVFDQVQVPA
jgi:hypothetical protein